MSIRQKTLEAEIKRVQNSIALKENVIRIYSKENTPKSCEKVKSLSIELATLNEIKKALLNL